MRVCDSKSIKNMDKMCIKEIGIPSIVLMENASFKILKNLNLEKKRYTIVSGSGNNGGDGLALARQLISLGKQVDIFLINLKNNLSEDCRQNFRILDNIKANIKLIDDDYDFKDLIESLTFSDITIDCIFGIGLNKKVLGIHEEIIDLINKYAKYVLSVDVPSGINSDTGEIEGICVKANKTVSFQVFKSGFLNYKTLEYLGNITIEPIGIPKEVITKVTKEIFLTTKEFVKKHIKKREKYMHKGNFGKVTIFSGITGFSGAAYICTESAVKSGSGLVTLCCHKDIQHILSTKLTEAMTCNFEEIKLINELIVKSDSIAIGPGLGNNSKTLELLKNIIFNSSCPIIIDADGINVLSDNINLLKNCKEKIIITPHPGEMSRITGYSVDYINMNRIDVAKEVANKYNIIVLLKGYYTVITDGDVVYINPTGNSTMASGGMGDCLTGIITSMIGQGIPIFEAVVLSAYIHGYIGDELSKCNNSVIATDIINSLQTTIKRIT